MTFRVQLLWVSEDGAEERREVLEIERGALAMETLGLTLAEGKAVLHEVQRCVVAQQVADDLERQRACPDCGTRHTSKGQGSIEVQTVFGPVALPNPRWNRCSCRTTGPQTFRPTTTWLRGQTSPALLVPTVPRSSCLTPDFLMLSASCGISFRRRGAEMRAPFNGHPGLPLRRCAQPLHDAMGGA